MEESLGTNHGGGLMGKESWWRHLGEASGRRLEGTLQGWLEWYLFENRRHSATECKSALLLLLLLCVNKGTTHQVLRMATIGDARLGGGVATPDKGPLTNTARTPQAKAV